MRTSFSTFLLQIFYRGIDIDGEMEKLWALSAFGRKFCGTLSGDKSGMCQPIFAATQPGPRKHRCLIRYNDSSFTKHLLSVALRRNMNGTRSHMPICRHLKWQQALWGSGVGEARWWVKERGPSLNQCPGTLKYMFLQPSDLLRFVRYARFVASWRQDPTLKGYFVILLLS